MSNFKAKMTTWGVFVNGLKLPLSADLSTKLEREYQSSNKRSLVDIPGSGCPLCLNKHNFFMECAFVMELDDEFPQAVCDNRDKQILLFRERNCVREWYNGQVWEALEDVNFDKMIAERFLQHRQRNIPDDNLKFQIRRRIK